MLEGHVVAGAPRELGAKSRENTIFDVALGGDVTDLLLSGLQRLHTGVQLVVLEHGDGVDVADVAHSLQLVQVLRVVHEVEHEVVLHGDVEGLHLLGVGSSLGHGRVDRVLSLHELVVLGVDLVDDAWGVDVGAVTIPVDGLQLRGSLSFVIVVEDSGELTMGVTGGLSGSGSTHSLEPVGGEVLAYSVYDLAKSLITYF